MRRSVWCLIIGIGCLAFGFSARQTKASGPLSLPVPNPQTRISCGWFCYKYNNGGWHSAIDYSIPYGTPIYAAAAGVVTEAKSEPPDLPDDKKGYGTRVKIQHADNLLTIYAHLTRYVVTTGQTVSAGELIGYSDNTGASKGNHLHFEVRRGNEKLDPYGSDHAAPNCSADSLWKECPPTPADPETSEMAHSTTEYWREPADYEAPSRQGAVAGAEGTSLPIYYLGQLDAHKGYDSPTRQMAGGNFESGGPDGILINSQADNHLHYNAGLNLDDPDGNFINKRDRMIPPAGGRKINALTMGNFAGGTEDIAAVNFEGDDIIYFYHDYKEIGHLDAHGGTPKITALSAGDADADKAAELFVATAGDDHIYMYDNFKRWWQGTIWDWLSDADRMDQITYLDAFEDHNPEIADIATVDLDNNDHEELAVATTDTDHVYLYYYEKSSPWYAPWARSARLVMQGMVNAHSDSMPKINHLGAARLTDGQDYLLINCKDDDHIYLYWERDFEHVFDGKTSGSGFLKKKVKLDPLAGNPRLADMAGVDLDSNGIEELALVTSENDNIVIYGQGVGGSEADTGPVERLQAEIVDAPDNLVLLPGETATVSIEFKNIGYESWLSGSAYAPELVSTYAPNRFKHSSWLTDTTVTSLPQITSTGSSVAITFSLTAPSGPGNYTESFRLQIPGDAVIADSYFDLEIEVVNYRARVQRVWPQQVLIKPNSAFAITATYLNSGSMAWKPGEVLLHSDLSVATAPPTTLIQPGQTAQFTLPLTSPNISKKQTVSLWLTDRRGQIIAGSNTSFILISDGEAPSIPDWLLPDPLSGVWLGGATLDKTPRFLWEAAGDRLSALGRYLFYLDGRLYDQTALSSENLREALESGSHEVAVRATDVMDNISDPITYEFEVRDAATITLAADTDYLIAGPDHRAQITVTIYDEAGAIYPVEQELICSATAGEITEPAFSGQNYVLEFSSPTTAGNAEITCSLDAEINPDTLILAIVPDSPSGDIDLRGSADRAPADGVSQVQIVSNIIFDQYGNQIPDTEDFTVSASLGRIISTDISPNLEGIQVRTANGRLAFEMQATLFDGRDIITAQSVNGSAFGEIEILFLDVTAPPTPALTAPADGLISQYNAQAVQGTAEELSRVVINDNGNDIADLNSGATGHFYATMAFADGSHALRAKACDVAGNCSDYTSSHTIIIDTQSPVFTGTSPADEVEIHHQNHTVFVGWSDSGSGIDIPRGRLFIDGNEVNPARNSEGMSYNRDFADGFHWINARIYDRAGNEAQCQFEFTVKTSLLLLSDSHEPHPAWTVPNWDFERGQYPTDIPWNQVWWDDVDWHQAVPSPSPPWGNPLPGTEWLWTDDVIDSAETMLVRRKFEIPAGVNITFAQLEVATDDKSWNYINGQFVGTAWTMEDNLIVDVSPQLTIGGPNVLAAQASNIRLEEPITENNAGWGYKLEIRWSD